MTTDQLATKNIAITAEALFARGDIGRCELIYGELIMMSPAGAEHGVVARRLSGVVGSFVESRKLGHVFAAETGFVLDRAPDLVRAPDASFVLKDRLPGGKVPRGYFEGPPDLAVEVISPGESRTAVAEKVNMWLAHGTKSVWVADPSLQTIAVHRVGLATERFNLSESLTDSTLPGLTVRVAEIFDLL